MIKLLCLGFNPDFSVSKHVSVQEQPDSSRPVFLRDAPLLSGFKSWQPTLVVFLGMSATTTTKKKKDHNILRVPWLTHIHPSIPAHGLRGSQCGERKKNSLTVIVFIHIDCSSDRAVRQKVCPAETSRKMENEMENECFSRGIFFAFPADRQSKPVRWQTDEVKWMSAAKLKGKERIREAEGGVWVWFKGWSLIVDEVFQRCLTAMWDSSSASPSLLHPQLLRLHSH